jgi:ABC-2 type transport system permease protein
MIQLLTKDLRIQKRFIIAGFFLVGILFFALGAFEGVPVALPGTIFSYFLIIVASKMDERNHHGRLLASFPLLRRDIVTAKYLGMFMFMGIAFLTAFVWRIMAQLFIPTEQLPWYDLKSTMTAIVVLIVYVSIYFPLYFALGSRIGSFLDLIVGVTIVGFALILLSLFQGINANVMQVFKQLITLSSFATVLGTFGGSIALLSLSWFLSLYMYNRRDI